LLVSIRPCICKIKMQPILPHRIIELKQFSRRLESNCSLYQDHRYLRKNKPLIVLGLNTSLHQQGQNSLSMIACKIRKCGREITMHSFILVGSVTSPEPLT
jgi:hypothetical protein